MQHNNPFHLTPSLTPFDGFRKGMKRSPTVRMGAHAVARDAAGGVGGLKKAETS